MQCEHCDHQETRDIRLRDQLARIFVHPLPLCDRHAREELQSREVRQFAGED